MSAVPDTDPNQTERFLTILDESADSFCFRAFNDNAKTVQAIPEKFDGTYEQALPWMIKKQGQGCGVYVVINAGGQNNESITRVRAVYVDTDGAPLDPIITCGLEPHVIVESSPGRYHVYWLVDGLELQAFRGVQHALIKQFGTDKSVNDLARVMRLPGMMHLKGTPYLARIIHESGGVPYSAETILAHFAIEASSAALAPTASSQGIGPGVVVETDRHADLLKMTLLLAADVQRGSITREEAFQLMRQRVANGRYTRDIPEDEITRALDGALRRHDLSAPIQAQHDPDELTHALIAAMCPLSVAEIQAAATPHAHAFQGGYKNKVGLFPIGEVTVIGAPGREGKTSMVVSIAQAYASGWTLGGLTPQPDRAVAIYSGEDDREQYARKLGGHYVRLPPADAETLRQSIIIPDLHGELLGPVREIVTVNARVPTRGVIVESLVAAIRTNPRIGLVIVETASTVSAAEEDNAGHRVLISALKYVAKMTNTAVVLTHHTSQAAASKLPDLDVSEADIRGGTALVNNARQTFLPVSLGSTNDPHPDGDARTALRKLVSPGTQDRVTVLICLSSSKSMDPPPIFFGWSIDDDYDPRLGEITPPESIAGKAWRAVRGILAGARADQKADKKAESGQANVRLVVKAVADIQDKAEQPTANKVSTACGRNPGWAKPYLNAAVEQGELVRSTENVPRSNGLVDVYRVAGETVIPWKSE